MKEKTICQNKKKYWINSIGLLVGFFFLFIFKFFGYLVNIDISILGILGILIGMLTLWLTNECASWTSLLSIFAFFFIPKLKIEEVLANSFGNTTIIFLLFTFVSSYSITSSSIIERITFFFINNNLSRKNGWYLICLFLTSILIIGLFVSPTVLFLLLQPIVKKIISVAKIQKDEKVGKILLMGVAFTVSISSGMTPISHVFPIIAFNIAGLDINYLKYMLFGIPVGICCFITMLLLFRFVVNPDVSKLNEINTELIIDKCGPLSKKEKIYLFTFIFIISLWIIPPLFEYFWADFSKYFNRLGIAFPAILWALILSVIKIDNEHIFSLEKSLKENVPWSSLLMCACSSLLGFAMSSNIGFKEYIQNLIGTQLSNLPFILLCSTLCLWALIQTNLSSNIVTATIVSSIAVFIFKKTSHSSDLETLIMLIGLASSFAFATPLSMPHISLICLDEYCDMKSVVKYGSILTFISFVIIIAIGLPIANILTH